MTVPGELRYCDRALGIPRLPLSDVMITECHCREWRRDQFAGRANPLETASFGLHRHWGRRRRLL